MGENPAETYEVRSKTGEGNCACARRSGNAVERVRAAGERKCMADPYF